MKELSDQYDKKSNKKVKTISFNKFSSFAQAHPTILFPIFDFQRILQNKILGSSYWEKQGTLRIQRDQGEYKSIKHIFNPIKDAIINFERGQSFCNKKNHINRTSKYKAK
jgi:hypothetical protein